MVSELGYDDAVLVLAQAEIDLHMPYESKMTKEKPAEKTGSTTSKHTK